MTSKKKKQKQAGFTLIELMISLAMVAILTGTALQIARFSDTHKNLTIAANEVRAAIRMAQSYAFSVPTSDADHICGFGFYADGSSYKVYYVYVSDSEYQANAESCLDAEKSYSGNKTDVKSGNLASGVVFENSGYVFFEAPYGDVESGTEKSFTINGAGGNQTIITVTSTGKID